MATLHPENIDLMEVSTNHNKLLQLKVKRY